MITQVRFEFGHGRMIFLTVISSIRGLSGLLRAHPGGIEGQGQPFAR
jgi:hypothetical protein